MYAGAIEWNNLDSDVRNIEDVGKLKINTEIMDVKYIY